MSKALELPKLSKKISFRGSGTSWGRGGVSRGDRLRGGWDWLWFLCGGARRGKGLIAIFRDFFASAGGVVVLALGYHSVEFIFSNF